MMEEVAISIGDVLIPMMRELMEKQIMPLIQRFQGLSSVSKATAIKIAMIAAAIGPLFLILSKVFKLFSIGAKLLALLASPVGLIVIAIGVLIFALYSLFKTNDKFRAKVLYIWNAIMQGISKAISFIVEWWNIKGRELYNKTAVVFTMIWSIIVQVLDQIVASVIVFFGYLSPIWEQIKALFISLWDVFSELWLLLEPLFKALGVVVVTMYGIWIGKINGIIQAMGSFIKAILNAVQIIIDIVGVIVSLLKGDLSGAMEHIESIGENTREFFLNMFQAILNYCKGFIDGFLGFFNSLGIDLEGIIRDISDSISNWFANIGKSITNTAVNIWKAITGTINGIGDYFKGLFNDAFDWGKNLILCIVDGINSAIEWVGDSIKNVGQKIKDYLGFSSPTKEGPGKDADKWMPNMMGMFSEGIRQGLPDIEGAVDLTSNTLGGVNGLSSSLSQRDDSNLINGIMSSLTLLGGNQKSNNEPVELSIDGQVFARLIMPSLTKEFKRNGILLESV